MYLFFNIALTRNIKIITIILIKEPKLKKGPLSGCLVCAQAARPHAFLSSHAEIRSQLPYEIN